jgi:hypothetical protein
MKVAGNNNPAMLAIKEIEEVLRKHNCFLSLSETEIIANINEEERTYRLFSDGKENAILLGDDVERQITLKLIDENF